MDPTKLPDDLLLFKDKLSPRFYEVRTKLLAFINEDLMPAGKIYREQKNKMLVHDKVFGTLLTPEPPIVAELREKAKARGLYNFFLPEVSQLAALQHLILLL
jgi:acyl-CoA dehydrogenase